jgi:hypothetical protein
MHFVLADVVWPALFLAGRMMAWWAIGLGLVVEAGTWAATFIFAVFIDAALEASVLRYGFKQRPFKRLFWWLALANAISVGIAMASLFKYPPQP